MKKMSYELEEIRKNKLQNLTYHLEKQTNGELN